MFRIFCANRVAGVPWPPAYGITEDMAKADAVLVRSARLEDVPEGVLAVARAGAGVNHIPVQRLGEQGVVVMNTPGANASSVAELAVCAVLMGARRVAEGIEWARELEGDIPAEVERGKSRFIGMELGGKTLGIIGMGAVGSRLAELAFRLDMRVLAYDPLLPPDRRAGLPGKFVEELAPLLSRSDFVSLHVPLTPLTKGMIGQGELAAMKQGGILVNLARGELVEDGALAQALASGRPGRYITDFPNERTVRMPGVLAIPHLGASTREAEENCARMAAAQLREYLENGGIQNSVNFPDCPAGPWRGEGRLAVLHKNIPSTISRLGGVLAEENIANLVNRSRGDLAYTLIDTDRPVPLQTAARLGAVEGVFRVRVLAQSI